MRTFVTGGAGFLGRRVVEQLLTEGHHVVCLLRGRTDAAPLELAASRGADRLVIVRGMIGRPETYRHALVGADVVFHAAAEMRGSVAVLFATNVIATRTLLAEASDAHVGRVVLVSSMGVYSAGALPRHSSLDESCPLEELPHLRDGYSYSKIAEEQVAWEAREARRLPLVVVRPGVIYGPGRDWLSSRIGLRIGGLLLKMGGRQVVPYTYVENCADAICRAGFAPGAEGHAFNVVDDGLPTANALLRRYRRDVGRLRVVPIPSWAIRPLSKVSAWYHEYSQGQLPAVLTPYRSDAQWKPLRYSNERAKRMLGWRPATGFDQGLARTAASLRPRAVVA
jgi:nucleoside-diphosphate-sugar epimerase